MNTTLHISIDQKTKTEAANLAADLGLDLSTIVKASLKSFIMTKRFEVEKSYRMTPYLEQVIGQAKKDFASRRNVSGPFSTTKELKKHFSKSHRPSNSRPEGAEHAHRPPARSQKK